MEIITNHGCEKAGLLGSPAGAPKKRRLNERRYVF